MGYLQPIDARILLAQDLSSAATARRFVDRTLDEWDCEGLTDIAELLVSELVTNALLHGRTQAELTLRLTEGRLRVEVADGNPKQPIRKRYAEDAGTGRGIGIVEELASAWGVESYPGGKKVWLELMAPGSLPPVAALEVKGEDDDWVRARYPPRSAGAGSRVRGPGRGGSRQRQEDHRPKAWSMVFSEPIRVESQ